MKTTITISVPGKIHLLGEHSAVYGKPAILATIDKRCTVTLKTHSSSSVTLTSMNFNQSVQVKFRDILEKAKHATEIWQKFSEVNDMSLLKSITKNSLDYPLIIIGEALRYYKTSTIPSGFSLTIDSQIPIGYGLGSSAACAVGITAAVTVFLKKPFDKHIINEIAYRAEQKIHGYPSGGDNSSVCFGGAIWYRKEASEFKIVQPLPFSIPKNIAQNCTLIDSGKPHETTGELVSQVRSLYSREKTKVSGILNHQESLTRQLFTVLKVGDEKEFLQIIRQGQRNLEKLGVVSVYVKQIIRAIEEGGGAGKIIGGGGIQRGTGMILAYHPKIQQIKEVATHYNLPLHPIKVGVQGLSYIYD